MKIDWTEVQRGISDELKKSAAVPAKPIASAWGKFSKGLGRVVRHPAFTLGTTGLMLKGSMGGAEAPQEMQQLRRLGGYLPHIGFNPNQAINPDQPINVVLSKPGIDLLNVRGSGVHSLTSPKNFNSY